MCEFPWFKLLEDTWTRISQNLGNTYREILISRSKYITSRKWHLECIFRGFDSSFTCPRFFQTDIPRLLISRFTSIKWLNFTNGAFKFCRFKFILAFSPQNFNDWLFTWESLAETFLEHVWTSYFSDLPFLVNHINFLLYMDDSSWL